MTVALIDADLVAYRCAASCEKREKGELIALDPVEIAIARADTLIHDILYGTQADEYRAFLSGKNNFRYKINPNYKANRRDTPKPEHLDACREFLATEWKASVTEGYEADDALGINQTDNTIICSLDKDLRMIPGKHYSWQIEGTSVNGKKWIREASLTEVSPIDGLRTFYKQMLIGDTSDNITGIRGIGEVKAAKLIDHLTTEESMFGEVYRMYSDDTRFYMNADCLWVLQKEDTQYSKRNKDVSLQR